MLEQVKRSCKNYLFKDYGSLKLFFIILCSLAIFQELYVFFILKPTVTSSVKTQMTNEDIPEILLCPEPSFDSEEIKNKGYADFWYYILGQDYGWNGQNKTDVKELYQHISFLKSPQDCPVKNSAFFTEPSDEDNEPTSCQNSVEQIDFKIARALYPMHTCCRIANSEISKDLNVYGGQLAFEAAKNYTFSQFKILMADKTSFSTFRHHEATTFGDKISLSSKQGWNTFNIKVHQEQHLENDPNYPCIDYKKPGDYDQCLEEEYLSRIRKYVNCTPPWFTENEDLWCKNGINFRTESDQKKFVKILEKIVLARADTGKCSGKNDKSMNPSNYIVNHVTCKLFNSLSIKCFEYFSSLQDYKIFHQ